MREWTWQELQTSGESHSLGQRFFFTMFEKPKDLPEQPKDMQRFWLVPLWRNPCWYTVNGREPLTLLGGEQE